jgi:ribosomal-protein-serine acetyltransferase
MFRAAVRSGLELRLLEERHSTLVYALADRDREHLREWFAWVDATESEDDILAFIRRSLDQFATNSGFSAGIWEHERYAGNITLHKVDWLNRRAEIGYWVGREFQGRGIVTDACRAEISKCTRWLLCRNPRQPLRFGPDCPTDLLANPIPQSLWALT